MRSRLIDVAVAISLLATGQAFAEEKPPAEAAAELLRRAAPEPQAEFGYIFNLDAPPTFAWSDSALAKAHGGLPQVEEVAWFDAKGERFTQPEHAGRWIAIVRSRLADGRTVMRGITLFARTEGFFLLPLESLGMRLEAIEGASQTPLAEHQGEIQQQLERGLLELINGDPRGAKLVTAWHDAQQEDGEAKLHYGVEDRARQCELQARIQYMRREVQPLPAPRRLNGEPAHELRPAEPPPEKQARAELDRICQAWADESEAPFVSLVAHHGQILHHQAYTPAGQEKIDRDFRADVFSITKSISGMLAARFLDAGLFSLDDPVSTVLPGFDQFPENVPTFRQCLRHQSGLKGHGSWGGVGNVWFDHLVLNGIDTLHPGERKYAGDGFDLVGAAMQLLTGETATRLLHRGYFEPLGLPSIPLGQMGAGARPTAFELAVLAQVLANGGRYGEHEFFSADTFQSMLPRPYGEFENPDPDNKNHYYGLGIRWVRELRDEAGEPLFSRRTVGHGSFSHSVFLVDLERAIVVAQVRQKNSKADATWYPRFLRAVSQMTQGK